MAWRTGHPPQGITELEFEALELCRKDPRGRRHESRWFLHRIYGEIDLGTGSGRSRYGSITRTLRRLVKKGLLARHEEHHVGRRPIPGVAERWSLTEGGREALR